MAITSFTYDVYGVNPRKVVFHVVTSGGQTFDYPIITSDPLWDPAAMSAILEAGLNATLAKQEVTAWINGPIDLPVIMRDATKADYAAGIRQAYKEFTKEELWRLAYKLYERYQARDFTAAQLRTAFGMTTPQFNDFAKNKLIPAHDRYAELLAAVGE